jgi:deaminated glutathione amidase
VLAIPAAFTVSTGEAHWHILMRARAIETGCFVLAAAQSGDHADGRATFGHSIAVDPWCALLADGGPGDGNSRYRVLLAPVDGAAVDRARQAIALDRSRRNRRVSL